MPNFKDIERFGKNKASIVAQQQEELMSLSKSLDRKLYNYLLSKILPKFTFGADGRLTNSNANIDASRNIKQLKEYMNGTVNRQMKSYYLSSAKNTIEASNKYFKLFKPRKELLKSINNKSKTISNRLIVSIFTQSNVQSQIEAALGTAVLGGAKEQELEASIKDLVLGKEDKMGINQSYHYQNGYDTLQSQSRTIDATFAKGLQLNYAIWTGGEILTTRDFCEQRNGKVFLREEIEQMQELEWSGKKKFHVMLADCGGYNCRHYYSWISYQLAKRLREGIPRSEYDK